MAGLTSELTQLAAYATVFLTGFGLLFCAGQRRYGWES